MSAFSISVGEEWEVEGKRRVRGGGLSFKVRANGGGVVISFLLGSSTGGPVGEGCLSALLGVWWSIASAAGPYYDEAQKIMHFHGRCLS